ncbi:methyltransferase domain-containing protein [Streptomyces sp. NPDC050743]|uniref:methyltransferase domain-containing protein n=1 Tax=Streptomyces sp. NPDC050743 TaxID=3365634 RepID=UPI0037A39C5E
MRCRPWAWPEPLCIWAISTKTLIRSSPLVRFERPSHILPGYNPYSWLGSWLTGTHDIICVRDGQARPRQLSRPARHERSRPLLQTADARRTRPACRTPGARPRRGPGTDLEALAQAVTPAGAVVGVDRDRNMVDAARARTAGEAMVDVRHADIHDLPMPDLTADRARTDRVLQHIADPLAALGEIRRVLRPGGRLVMGEPDWETLAVDHPDSDLTRACTRHVAEPGRPQRGDRQATGAPGDRERLQGAHGHPCHTCLPGRPGRGQVPRPGTHHPARSRGPAISATGRRKPG